MTEQELTAVKIALPEKIRTFKMVLTRRKEYDYPFYSGSNGYSRVNLQQEEDGTWLAAGLFRNTIVKPDLTSSSFRAALRNLRGHLRNLAIDLNRMKIEPR